MLDHNNGNNNSVTAVSILAGCWHMKVIKTRTHTHTHIHTKAMLLLLACTHICPVKSREAPRPEDSPPNLHSAGLYGWETDGSTRIYLQDQIRREKRIKEEKMPQVWKSSEITPRSGASYGMG